MKNINNEVLIDLLIDYNIELRIRLRKLKKYPATNKEEIKEVIIKLKKVRTQIEKISKL